jgi:hypothetical protein
MVAEQNLFSFAFIVMASKLFDLGKWNFSLVVDLEHTFSVVNINFMLKITNMAGVQKLVVIPGKFSIESVVVEFVV